MLSELRADVPSAGSGAGLENMRAIAISGGCDPKDVLDFLTTAADIWLARAALAGIAPATFYAWYDDMTGQLRMSLVPGAAVDAAPFSGNIDLLPSPHAIVRAALSTWTPAWCRGPTSPMLNGRNRADEIAAWLSGRGLEAPANPPLQRTTDSLASLGRALAAERQYR